MRSLLSLPHEIADQRSLAIAREAAKAREEQAAAARRASMEILKVEAISLKLPFVKKSDKSSE